MPNKDWLSLKETARLWSDETGESAERIERDLNAWFSEFVAREPSREPGSPGTDEKSTDLLMDILGGRHLRYETLEIYCDEKGLAKPNFWTAGGAEYEEPDSLPFSNSPTIDEIQALHGYGPKAGLAQHQNEEPRAQWEGDHHQPAEPAPESVHEASWPAANRPTPCDPVATHESGSTTTAWPDPNPVWYLADERLRKTYERHLAWVRAFLPLGRRLTGRKATWLAGSLALGLSVLAMVFVLEQGGSGPAETGLDVAGRDQSLTALVNSLRNELVRARSQIATLETALETAEAEVSRLTGSLLTSQRSMGETLAAAQLKAEASAAQAASFRAELAVAQKQIASLNARAAASAKAMSFEAALEQARQRIADLEREVQTAKADADILAVELTEIRQRDQTVRQNKNAPAQPDANAAAESIDVDSLVTNPSRYDGHQVVVTGSLLRLLKRYRLQSQSGWKTLIVDVTEIHRAQHDKLKESIAKAGPIGLVRAQINGKVERGSAETFRLVASEVTLIE